MKSRRAIYGLLLLVGAGVLAVVGWKAYEQVMSRERAPSSQSGVNPAQVSERTRELKRLLIQTADIAREIKDSENRATALSWIAEALADAGMSEHALETAEQALKNAEKIRNSWHRAFALGKIATALVKAGAPERATEVMEKALKTAENIEDDMFRGGALSGIANAIAQEIRRLKGQEN